MKTRHFVLSLLGMMLCTGSFAKIVMDDPVITDSYIKFVGTNTDNNYKYTLDTYEWADRGPQFQLTIEALDATQPATITTADLSDENYWEPLFRFYTQQLAGQAMEANDNIKKLIIKDVALQPNHFNQYEDLKSITIEASGDYTIPDGCFGNDTKLDNFYSNVSGTLTLSTNVVSPYPAFVVTCSTIGEAQTWLQYKNDNGCAFTVVSGGGGGIVEEEPIITDSYMKFSGVNAANNYRFILDTYEWADRGPQFQITIERLDASKPAAFTDADLADENYWEALFRKYTKQLAGEEMEANDNVKQLIVKNVDLLPNMFSNYEYVHLINIVADEAYTIPDGCFQNINKLDKFESNVNGTLTLGSNVVNPGLAFTVTCSSDTEKEVWRQYKGNYGCSFIIEGDGGEQLHIDEVAIGITVNGYSTKLPLSDSSGTINNIKNISDCTFNWYEVGASEGVLEITLDYCICPQGTVPSSDMWSQIRAKQQSDGKWKAENLNLDLLAGLDSNTGYQLFFSFRTNDGENGRATYPSDGGQFMLEFSTGEITAVSSVVNAQSLMSDSWYTLDGRRLNGQPATKGIYINNGKKILIK